MTLTEFLLARIAEDEACARKVPGDGEFCTWNRSWDMSPTRDLVVDGERVAPLPMTMDEHICRWDPARVLAECEAKRLAIEAAWDDHCKIEGEWGQGQSEKEMSANDDNPEVVEALALPYADHEDYRPEWAT